VFHRGPGSVVGIETGYGLDSPGIESRWRRNFPHLSRLAMWPTHSPVQWVPGLSWGLKRPERAADPSPLSSAVVVKGYSYTSTPPMGRTACTEPQCLYKGALYLAVELYLYSPYGPYSLHRASVPVQGCTCSVSYHRVSTTQTLNSVTVRFQKNQDYFVGT